MSQKDQKLLIIQNYDIVFLDESENTKGEVAVIFHEKELSHLMQNINTDLLQNLKIAEITTTQHNQHQIEFKDYLKPTQNIKIIFPLPLQIIQTILIANKKYIWIGVNDDERFIYNKKIKLISNKT